MIPNFGQASPVAPVTTITGAPYSAEQTQQRVQTLADGTKLTEAQPVQKIYRDSAGRTRTEQAPAAGPPGAGAPLPVKIVDPVSGTKYLLDPANKITHCLPVHIAPPAPPRPVVTAPATMPAVPKPFGNIPQIQTETQSLGTKTINGVVAEGQLMTKTIPAGAVGNEAPIKITAEYWHSPDLKALVSSKINDPRSGETTTQLTNISQGEPHPSLFQPPPGYSIVHEKG